VVTILLMFPTIIFFHQQPMLFFSMVCWNYCSNANYKHFRPPLSRIIFC